MYYFGIDWSEEHHNLSIHNEKGAEISVLEFPHTLAGFQRLETEREKLAVTPTDCWVAIETRHNLLVEFLQERGYVVHVIPPRATKSYRHRYSASGAHTDASDATLLARVLRTDGDQYQPLRCDSPLTQRLRAQVRFVEQLRRSVQRHSNQLRAVLLRVYPQAVGLFGKLTAYISLEFLKAYPTAAAATALSLTAFSDFCRQQHYTCPRLIPQRYAHLIAPAPTALPATVQAYQDQIPVLADLLLHHVRYHKAAQAELQRLFPQHPDAEIFASLPGAGDLLAPALLVKFGDHRDRFPAPGDVQALAGTCPATDSSGKRKRVYFRHSCDKEFRRIIQHFARASVRESGWALAYFQAAVPVCASTSHAYRRLANRWLAIIWKLWQTRQLYDEGYHLRQRAARQRPRA
jgi:transposase